MNAADKELTASDIKIIIKDIIAIAMDDYIPYKEVKDTINRMNNIAELL